jgi:CheY-like chemotaxis protein
MRHRILIADDSPAVRSALRSLLENAGPWDVIDAENGREAFAKAQELKPDLIILDLVMPDMDGLTAARRISQSLPQIPILLHTMHWSPQVNVEAQKVGVRQVVSKADSRLLIATVQSFLGPATSPGASSTFVTPVEPAAGCDTPAAATGKKDDDRDACRGNDNQAQ